MFNIVTNGFAAAVGDFVNELSGTSLEGQLLSWLMGPNSQMTGFSGLATSKKKLQQDRAEVKAIVRGLERIRRYIAANRAEAEAFVKQFLNLNDKEARLSVAQMVKSFRDTGRTTDEAVIDFIETTLKSTKATSRPRATASGTIVAPKRRSLRAR